MIAYNKNWLYHLYVQEQVQEAVEAGCLDKMEAARIREFYPVGFYTPNLYIRFGLFLLTIIMILFSVGLAILMMMDLLEKSPAAFSILFGLFTYSALEFFIADNHHYRSGVDDALLWSSAGMLFGGSSYGLDASPLLMCWLAFIYALFFTARFADRLMALASFVSMVGILYFTCTTTGDFLKAMVPFVLMLATGFTYFMTRSKSSAGPFFNYKSCLTIIEIATLLVFYAAGNYYVVSALKNTMPGINWSPGSAIPLGKWFWSFTILFPVAYLSLGIKYKNAILLRCSLLTIASSILTFHHYYPITPVETAMATGGTCLVIISIALIRFLKKPKYGFTHLALVPANKVTTEQVEQLVIAETFGKPRADQPVTRFGGGSFGGGGAGSNF